MAKKWYVVIVGKAPGIYTSWIEVAPLVYGVPGSVHQSFTTEEEARHYYEKAGSPGAVPDPPDSGYSEAECAADAEPMRQGFVSNMCPALPTGDIKPEKKARMRTATKDEPAYKKDASSQALRMTSTGASTSMLRTASVPSPRHVAVQTTASVSQSPKLSSPTTGVTYIVPSDGGTPVRRTPGSEARRRALEEGFRSASGIHVSSFHDSPVRTPSGIRVTRWRSESSVSLSSTSPPTEVTQHEPMDPSTPRFAVATTHANKNGREMQSPMATVCTPESASSYPRLSPSSSRVADGAPMNQRRPLAVSPKRSHNTPQRHTSVRTPDSATSYPDSSDDEDRSVYATPPSRKAAPVSKLPGMSAPRAVSARSSHSTPCKCQVCPHNCVLSEDKPPSPCGCRICPHSNILMEDRPPPPCGCQRCPHGNVLGRFSDAQRPTVPNTPSLSAHLTAASFGLSQPPHIPTVMHGPGPDPRSPLGGSISVSFRRSE